MSSTRSQLASRLRNVPIREFIAALERDGFEWNQHRRGSHRVYKHPDGRMAVIAFHKSNDTLPNRTLRAFLRATQWTEDDATRLDLL